MVMMELFRNINKIAHPQVTCSSYGEKVLTWFNGEDRVEAIVEDDRFLDCAKMVRGQVHYVGRFDMKSEDDCCRFYREMERFFSEPQSL